jgi:hypothetical protein
MPTWFASILYTFSNRNYRLTSQIKDDNMRLPYVGLQSEAHMSVYIVRDFDNQFIKKHIADWHFCSKGIQHLSRGDDLCFYSNYIYIKKKDGKQLKCGERFEFCVRCRGCSPFGCNYRNDE